ncbi:DUF87 domain-containing protein [bacterium]|nr:DUF87 domain-containing protein [bacterium]
MLFQLSSLADNERDPGYTESVLNGLHEANHRGLTVSLEYAMSGGSVGVFCRFPDDLRNVLMHQFSDAYPTCSLLHIDDHMLDSSPEETVVRADLRLAPDPYSIKTFGEFEDLISRTVRDPAAGLLSLVRTGRGGKLKTRIALSIRPARNFRYREARRVLSVLERPLPFKMLDDLYSKHAGSPRPLRRLLMWVLSWFAGKSAGNSVDDRKLQQHLFETHIQLIVSGQKGTNVEEKLSELVGAFGQFTSNKTKFRVDRISRSRRRRRGRGSLLSAAELATIWHPPMNTVRVDRMHKALFREQEPPLDLPSNENDQEATLLGRIRYRGRRDLFGIRTDDRRRHLFIVGKTGMGKSTLLSNMVASDIAAGRGVCLIDPHGDLGESVLDLVPKHRTNDVVLFDAGDKQFPVAFNPLVVGKGSDATLTADGVLSSFKKVFGFDEASAPRLLHIFRNSLLALVEMPGATLISVERILHDNAFRKQVLSRVDNPAVRDFWRNQFGKWNDRDRTQYIASLQNKLGAFLSNDTLQGIFGQSQGTIDFRHIMDEGKVLIVNLSKGRVGEDAASLLGALLVSNLQLAAMSRADTDEHERRDFFACVDEFQNFATDSFATILSEARKYRLSLTLANQHLSQLKDTNVLDAVFGNVGSLASFQVGADDAEFLSQQLACDITAKDLMNLPKYHAYIRLLVDGMPATPFSMSTLEPAVVKQTKAAHIRRMSRERYGRPRERVQKEVRQQYS